MQINANHSHPVAHVMQSEGIHRIIGVLTNYWLWVEVDETALLRTSHCYSLSVHHVMKWDETMCSRMKYSITHNLLVKG